MLTKKMQDALNEQVNAEFYSWYLYYSMSAWAESQNLRGSARWLNLQAQEEKVHAEKIFKFILDRGGVVDLKPIDAPKKKWKSLLEAFQDTLKHEQYITGRIHDLVELAAKEKDHASSAFLQWYVTEQVEEEANADQILQMLKQIGDAPAALFMLDSKLGSRG